MLNVKKALLRSDEVSVIRNSVKMFRDFNVKGSLSLYLKIRGCHRKYGWRPIEFFWYNYESLSEKERESFLSGIEASRFSKSVNSLAIRKLLRNKWKAYEAYNVFYHREACIVDPSNICVNGNGGGITI